MKTDAIINEVNKLKNMGRVRAVVTREHSGYIVSVMASYSYTDDSTGAIGSFGMKTALEISYNSEYSANKLKDMINN